MSDLAAALLAALLTGLLGSAHCLGMCAGISGLFAMHSSASGLRAQLPLAITYNLGRLVSYMVLGYAVAAVGIATFRPDQKAFAGHWTYHREGVRGNMNAAAAALVMTLVMNVHPTKITARAV